MILTVEEKRMLNGEKSPGEQLSMVWLKKYGEAFDAERMAKVDIVHMSTNVPLNLIDQMTEGLTQIRTPCSLHAVFNPTYWREKYDVIGDKDQLIGGLATADEEEFSQVINAFKRIGCIPCFTCVPYAVGFVLRQDDIFLGTGSSGQIVANSIFAARAGRDSTVTAFASAITGVTPYMGLLIKENRYAEVLIEAEGINFDKFTNAHYGALGYYIGEVAGPRNVVISGLPRKISLEKCKFLMSPIPVFGGCTMCHIVGVTPEAPTLKAALGGKKPLEEIKVGKKEIEDACGNLNNAEDENVDLVAVGCPHCLISELKEIASLLKGKRVNRDVHLVIATANSTYALAKDAGYADIIEKAGAIVSNICVSVVNPFIFLEGARVVATNSARAAYYIQRLVGGKTRVFYGEIDKCINSAITGKWGGQK